MSIEQGTGPWLAARRGKLTASRIAEAIARLKDKKAKDGTITLGDWSASRFNLMKDLVAERMTDASVEHFTSPEMKWGILYEPDAKNEYEDVTGHILAPAGFVDHPHIDGLGASPDAYQGRDTVVEFKCPKTTTHLQYLLNGDVPEAYRPQILTQLACTGRTKAVFVSYDPRVNGPKRLFICKWEPDPAEIVAIEGMAREFLIELEALFDRVTSIELAA